LAFASTTRTSRISRRCATRSTTSWRSWVDPLGDDHGELIGHLEHDFGDQGLLTLALTHRSWCAEHPGHEPNERLEFLGDAALGLVVTEHAYRSFAAMAEGELAKTRAGVVDAATLAEVARSIDLGSALRLGKGEEVSGGRDKTSILADAMEAVIGAVYLDGGYEAARRLVVRLFGPHVERASQGPGEGDFKTQLQELTARRFEELPAYELRGEGPDHERLFSARVLVGGQVVGEGSGRSKKSAEQAAAQAALAGLTAAEGDRA
jgi:ribonuclease-3